MWIGFVTSLSLSLSCITRVAPHCVNTLMILHVAHSKLFTPEGGGRRYLKPYVYGFNLYSLAAWALGL